MEDKLEYNRWYCGHYHVNRVIDEKHIVLYKSMIPLDIQEKGGYKSGADIKS